MFKKICVSAMAAGAMALAVAPAASAAPSLVFAGVYPSHTAAVNACNAGAAQGRWYKPCTYKAYSSGQVGLYVVPR